MTGRPFPWCLRVTMATRISCLWWRAWRMARSSAGRRRAWWSWTWPTTLGGHARAGCWRRTRRRWDRGEGGGKGGRKGEEVLRVSLGAPGLTGGFPAFSFLLRLSLCPSTSLSLPSLLYPSVLLFPSHLPRHKEFNGTTKKTTSQSDLLAGTKSSEESAK